MRDWFLFMSKKVLKINLLANSRSDSALMQKTRPIEDATLIKKLKNTIPEHCEISIERKKYLLHHFIKTERLTHLRSAIKHQQNSLDINAGDVTLLLSSSNFAQETDINEWNIKLEENKKKRVKDMLFFPLLSIATRDKMRALINEEWSLMKNTKKDQQIQ